MLHISHNMYITHTSYAYAYDPFYRLRYTIYAYNVLVNRVNIEVDDTC